MQYKPVRFFCILNWFYVIQVADDRVNYCNFTDFFMVVFQAAVFKTVLQKHKAVIWLYLPLLRRGHCLHTTIILALMFFPACCIAKFPSLYTLMIDIVACKLPARVVVEITVPVITRRNDIWYILINFYDLMDHRNKRICS